jgi:ATP-dependent DNA helicase RecG
MSLLPSSPLVAVRGVGPSIARTLVRGGFTAIEDLLLYFPYRYENRSEVRPIATLRQPERAVTVAGRVVALQTRRARNRRMTVVEGLVEDGSGAIPVVWFNQPYLARSIGRGERVWLYGPLRPARVGWGMQLVSPEWEVEEDEEEGPPVHLGRIVPIYRRIGSLSGRRVRTLMARILAEVELGTDPLAKLVPKDLGLPAREDALREVHFPVCPPGAGWGELSGWLAARTAPAQRRLALEELLSLAVTLERARQARRRQHAVRCVITAVVRERARAALPFKLTGAQRRVLAEIISDLQHDHPMARLLQGDVGSGKTIVATLAALVVLEAGAQVALLAPTELLAQQHAATLTRLLTTTPYRPRLLVGSLGAREKSALRRELAAGTIGLVVGTHALIEESVAFSRLGLAIVDEQHRFGVAQRQALREKGRAPHLLVMTATPIPRSLALSLYGDLNVSLLDELPPGRRPVRTVLRDDDARPRLLQFLLREIGEGGQAYWVFPLIEESESVSARAVASHVRAVRRALPGVTVGIVHGRLPAAERDEMMAAFAAGKVQVLCATTVIEVGIDVANASVMVIENAERFGLAQLHQLRGRVGRGRRRSFCVLLVGETESLEARHRLEVFAGTNDGFRIAEEDFRLRGPGEFTGLRQWGRPELRIASLLTHRRELEAARAAAAGASAAGRLDALEKALLRIGGIGETIPSG